MLLVAQRVLQPGKSRTQVNTFRYAHDVVVWPDFAVDAFDLPRVLLAKKVHSREGGNRVVSFLDVALPPDVTTAELKASLGKVSGLDEPPEGAFTFPGDRCAWRFYTGRPGPWKKEFAMLLTRALEA